MSTDLQRAERKAREAGRSLAVLERAFKRWRTSKKLAVLQVSDPLKAGAELDAWVKDLGLVRWLYQDKMRQLIELRRKLGVLA